MQIKKIKKKFVDLDKINNTSPNPSILFKLETLIDITLARNLNLNIKNLQKKANSEIRLKVLDSIFKIYFPNYYIITNEKFCLTTKSEEDIINTFINEIQFDFENSKTLSTKQAIFNTEQLIIFENCKGKKFYLLFTQEFNESNINLMAYLLKKYICDGNS